MKPAYLFIDGSNLYFDWLSVSHQSMDIRKFIDLVAGRISTARRCLTTPDRSGSFTASAAFPMCRLWRAA